MRFVFKNFNNRINEIKQKNNDVSMNENESNNIVENMNIKIEQLSENEKMIRIPNRAKIDSNCGKTKINNK